MKINPRLKIVLVASFLASLMEYSLRGINHFLETPHMSILVFANYFTYLIIIEELIGRFRLKDFQVWIVAQFFGLLWQLVSVAGVYYPPFVFGIGLGTLLINNLVWWPTIQTVFALYIGYRLTSQVDRNQSLLTKTGIFGFFAAYILISASWRLFVTPPVTAWQFIIMLSLTSLFAWFSYQTLATNLRKGVQFLPFKKDSFLDILAVLMIGYLIYSFFFLTGEGATTHVINPPALRVNLMISPLIALALVLRRIFTKKPIPV